MPMKKNFLTTNENSVSLYCARPENYCTVLYGRSSMPHTHKCKFKYTVGFRFKSQVKSQSSQKMQLQARLLQVVWQQRQKQEGVDIRSTHFSDFSGRLSSVSISTGISSLSLC